MKIVDKFFFLIIFMAWQFMFIHYIVIYDTWYFQSSIIWVTHSAKLGYNSLYSYSNYENPGKPSVNCLRAPPHFWASSPIDFNSVMCDLGKTIDACTSYIITYTRVIQ